MKPDYLHAPRDCPHCYIGNGDVTDVMQGLTDTVTTWRCQSCNARWTSISPIACTCDMSYELAPYACRVHQQPKALDIDGVKIIDMGD